MRPLTFQDLGFDIKTVSFDDGKCVNYLTVPTISTGDDVPAIFVITEKGSKLEISDGGLVFSQVLEIGLSSDSEDLQLLKDSVTEYGCEFVERAGGYVLILNTSRKDLPAAFCDFIDALSACSSMLNVFGAFYGDEDEDEDDEEEEVDLTDPPKQTGNA